MIARWGAGIAVSAAAHLGAAAALVWTVAPAPVIDQPVPETQLRLDAWAVERSRAAETAPDSTRTAPADASGAALGQGAIPQGRAEPAALPAAVLPAAVPQAPPVTALTETADRLDSAAAPATPARPLPPPGQTVSQTRPEPAALPAAVPRPDALSDSAPMPDALPAAAPQSEALPETNAPAPRAEPATPEVTSARATLAFGGVGDGPVDPVSLAAFQSFMQPGDAAGAAAELRDGIEGLLSQVPCARMQVRFEPETNSLQLTGHVPEDGLRAPVLAALQAQMGADIAVTDNLLILPRPQCGALGGIAAVGLPQSTDQITNPLLVGEDTHAAVFGFVKDQPLVLDLEGADYDAFVYVDYFDAAGDVLHLAPNEFVPLQEVPAEAPFRIGSLTELPPGAPGLFLKIGPPYGQEIVAAFAASAPLYDGTRPIREPAAPYLQWLADRVAAARAADPDFKGEWVYFFVSTAPG